MSTRHTLLAPLLVSVLIAPSVADTSIDGDPGPTITVHQGTPDQHRRLDLAIARFEGIGLTLPDLDVVFAPNREPCNGHHGLFDRNYVPWRVTICSDLDATYEHELAHAWVAATLTDDQKQRFMELRGYQTWSDRSVPWNERASEGAAFVIQQGLSGLPLPPTFSAEFQSRVAAFELLTGTPDPRLRPWTTAHGGGA